MGLFFESFFKSSAGLSAGARLRFGDQRLRRLARKRVTEVGEDPSKKIQSRESTLVRLSDVVMFLKVGAPRKQNYLYGSFVIKKRNRQQIATTSTTQNYG